jgi:hypothetical protein
MFIRDMRRFVDIKTCARASARFQVVDAPGFTQLRKERHANACVGSKYRVSKLEVKVPSRDGRLNASMRPAGGSVWEEPALSR